MSRPRHIISLLSVDTSRPLWSRDRFPPEAERLLEQERASMQEEMEQMLRDLDALEALDLACPEGEALRDGDDPVETLLPKRFLPAFSAEERELMEQEGASIEAEAERALATMRTIRKSKKTAAGWLNHRRHFPTPLSPEETLRWLQDARAGMLKEFQEIMSDLDRLEANEHWPGMEQFLERERTRFRADLENGLLEVEQEISSHQEELRRHQDGLKRTEIEEGQNGGDVE